ncbi:MAG TPA: type III-A CRISPR-associated protein Cas10/Csm1, partial [Armatimonadetes bacterium]|nr:type III-A CRISPR-associated protein Cas10/Csm1 [Armatimonadota bacterium]
NVLYSSGGHFSMLAPLSAQAQLSNLNRQIVSTLLDFFGGDVALVLDAVELHGSDFCIDTNANLSPLGECWSQLNAKLKAQKERLLREVAVSDIDGYTRVFGPFGTGGVETFCIVCHSEPNQPDGLAKHGIVRPVRTDVLEEAERKCSLCESFEDLSRTIAHAQYLLVRYTQYADQPADKMQGELRWHTVLQAFGIQIWLNDEEELVKRYRDGDCVFRLNQPNFAPVERNGKVVPVIGFRFMPTFTPLESDAEGDGVHIRDMDKMAQDSEGAPYYGVLRMDVDDLGRIFRIGLGVRMSLSRMMTLSRMLTMFFEGYLNRICHHIDPTCKHLYPIYSGGDDLFIVGSWDRIIKLAQEIHHCFHDYTCRNPAITISAGTSLHRKKYPLYQSADDAKGFLDIAKRYTHHDGHAKDAFCFWGATLDWSETMPWLQRWHDWLVEQIRADRSANKEASSRALLFKLMRIAELYYQREMELERRSNWTHEQIECRLRCERWLWRLVYYLSKEYKHLRDELDELSRSLVEDDHIRHLRLLTRWVELSTRGGD